MPQVLTLLSTDTKTHTAEQDIARFAEILGPLTKAIDLAEGNRDSHSLRTCIIGMKIGRRIGLEPSALSDLYYALLLKDIAGSHTQSLDMEMTGQGGLQARRLLREGRSGMSLREAGRAVLDLHGDKPLLERMRQRLAFLRKRKVLRAQTVLSRCATGDGLLKAMGMSAGTRAAVCALDEQWDGRGAPHGLRRGEIPVLAQVVKLAQMMELFYSQIGGGGVVPRLHRRCRGWFDPGLIAAATRLFESPSSWWPMEDKHLLACVVGLEPREHARIANAEAVDRICEVFAAVIDARSSYSSQHSAHVAELAARIARVLNMSEQQIQPLRRAALLHGMGKLVMPRHIMERRGPLSEEEVTLVRTYPLRTYEILHGLPAFEEAASIAVSLHERLDGSGYPHQLAAEQLSLPARVLAVANVAAALAAERSFREKYSGKQIYDILTDLTPHQLDVHCVDALLHDTVLSLVA